MKIYDIYSGSGDFVERTLSNLHEHHFTFDGIKYRCIEAFLQSLKCADPIQAEQFYGLDGIGAHRMGKKFHGWKKEQTLYYKGQPMHRLSDAYDGLIYNAYLSMFEQCPKFRKALEISKDGDLIHTMGCKDPTNTILTESEFVDILGDIRDLL